MTSLEKEENAGQSVDNLDESKDKKKKAFFLRKKSMITFQQPGKRGVKKTRNLSPTIGGMR